jgi:hypothetical protein
VIRADLATIDLLARFALIARRHGATIRLEHASRELLELLGLCGLADLADVLGVDVAERPGERGPSVPVRPGQSRRGGTPNSGK